MQELDKRIGLLRLLLANVQAKQAQIADMEKQYRAQLQRIVEFVIFREGDVTNALSLMSEVQGKLDETIHSTEHLKMIEDRATLELDVLVLTRKVADARTQLSELEMRQQELSGRLATITSSGLDEEGVFEVEDDEAQNISTIHDQVADVALEIDRLNRLITDASDRAARTIKSGVGDDEGRKTKDE